MSATTTHIASCRPLDDRAGPRKGSTGAGEVPNTSADPELTRWRKGGAGTTTPARTRPNPRFSILAILPATSPTPLATGLWMEGLGWSMIETKNFDRQFYRVLGCVKFSKLYFEQKIPKASAQVYRVMVKSAKTRCRGLCMDSNTHRELSQRPDRCRMFQCRGRVSILCLKSFCTKII